MILKQLLVNKVINSPGRIIGLCIGITIGILIIGIGFIKALFIVLCGLIGYYIGKKKDNNENFFELMGKFKSTKWK